MSIKMNNVNKMRELVAVLNKHRDAYYNKQSPTISDYEYNLLKKMIFLLYSALK